MTPNEFLEVADLLPDAIFLVTADGVVIAANRACTDVAHRWPSTIAGQRLADLVTDPLDKIAQFLHLCGRTRDPLPGSFAFKRNSDSVECRCDGTLFAPASPRTPAMILIRARPKHELTTRFRLLNEMIESLWKEIGERRRVEAALRASEEFNRRILMSSGDCIQVLDLDGNLLSMNEACSAMGLHSSKGHPGMQWLTQWQDEDRLAAEQALEDARAGHPGRFYASTSAKTTERRWWDIQITPMLDSRQVPERLVAVARDVTERRLSEERLRQSAKMEAIGRMAGGLAHDFNNNLHVLIGLAALVEEDARLVPGTRQDILEIKAVAEHMASLTRQLLAFSRRQMLKFETLDLNQAAAEAQPLLQRLLGGNIDFCLELTPRALWVQGDRAQLLQVMMNLAINSRDAMRGGGRLVIRTLERKVAARELDLLVGASVEAGTYAQLTVSDDGAGIAPEHLPHIFEPFYTTKPLGEGTGLGLATLHGIVMQSRGYVWAESELGRGSRFTILFPLASPAAPNATEMAEAS